MNKVLNIVNGDKVIEVMKEAELPGNFLPWRDFLHEGPVPENLSLETLSKLRAQYISERGFGNFNEVHQQFKERNAALLSFRKYEQIILWFEHDLYDQLQLIQILDWFAKYASSITSLFIISPDKHLAVCTPKKLKEMVLYKEPITHNQLIVARKAWAAFTSPTPEALSKLLNDDVSPLPFLSHAIYRMMEEYPNSINGLSKTEHQALLITANGLHHPHQIFEMYQSKEERRFMGDILFFDILKKFTQAGLLHSTKEGKHLEITELGKDVLRGDTNWLKLNTLDFWVGGVNITPQNLWNWNISQEKVVQRHIL